MPGYTRHSRGTARIPVPPGAAALPKRLTKVTYLEFATVPVWAPNPDSQPTKVYPPPLFQVHLGAGPWQDQSRPSA
jgi:hypothetical protein